MLNPFFLQGSASEQNLVQDLINEQLKIYGVDVYYIPRQYMTENTVINELIESEFNFAVPIEAYVNTYDGYGGQGTILSKFGVQDIDELSITISKEKFELYITPFIRNIPGIKLVDRPKEGDIIYFPLGERLFEIKYVEHEKPFYQLQKNYVYELRCELFRYEDEQIDTEIDFIDDKVESLGSIQTLNLVGSGTTATAVASIVNGGVKSIIISNRGSGYKSTPEVKFSSAPLGGDTATGIATMISNIVDFCEPDSSLLRVQGVEIINPGYGYTIAPPITFTGGGGSGVVATSVIADGIVGKINIIDGGSGYVAEPLVLVNPPPVGFATFRARAIVSAAGTISEIRLIDAGIGYTQSPTITIGDPIIIGAGSFIKNEKITGSVSGATALVKNWNFTTQKLDIYKRVGEFRSSEIVTGSESLASYKIKSINTDNINEPFYDNQEIQDEFNDIFDFSEKNPFGNP
jgi:hypothetical protein